MPLTNPSLLGYIRSRRDHQNAARKYCRELHFRVNGKPYFAIGFPNDSGGYELRNPYFKGCIPPKDVTTIRSGKAVDTIRVFEGFFDFLSALTLGYDLATTDTDRFPPPGFYGSV